MAWDWRVKKQLLYLGVLALIPLALLIYFAFQVGPEATCFDNKQNQREEGVD